MLFKLSLGIHEYRLGRPQSNNPTRPPFGEHKGENNFNIVGLKARPTF